MKAKSKSKKITLPKATQREMLKFFAQAFETMAAKEKDKQPQAWSHGRAVREANDQPPNYKGNKK